MLRLERATVHLVGEHDLGGGRVLEAETARVVVLVAFLDAVIGSGEHDFHGSVAEPRLGEHRRGAGSRSTRRCRSPRPATAG